jgi:hypothetical protein
LTRERERASRPYPLDGQPHGTSSERATQAQQADRYASEMLARVRNEAVANERAQRAHKRTQRTSASQIVPATQHALLDAAGSGPSGPTAFLENCQQARYPRPPEGTHGTSAAVTAGSGGPRAHLPEPDNALPPASSITELDQEEQELLQQLKLLKAKQAVQKSQAREAEGSPDRDPGPTGSGAAHQGQSSSSRPTAQRDNPCNPLSKEKLALLRDEFYANMYASSQHGTGPARQRRRATSSPPAL